jgi:unsaturated rhamnogalacturonyl hydrolase
MAELLRTVSNHVMAYPYKLWGYGEGIALEALISAGDYLREPRYWEFVGDLMDRWISAQSAIPYTDHVAPGKALLMLYQRSAQPKYLTRAVALAEFFVALPKTRQGARLHRPDHPDLANYVYVDCMDFDAPFLSLLGQVTGRRAYTDLAVDCLLGHARVLWDAEHSLFYHLYDAGRDQVNGAFWGRGNGWALLGIIGVLESAPPHHPRYNEIVGLFQRQIAAIATLQTENGDWHTVLNRPDTYLEGSLPAMFYCALMRGMQMGIISRAYLAPAQRAWQALLARLNSDGVLQGVSFATPPGTAEQYAAIPTGANCPWGQGPLLEALLIGEP